MRAAARVLGDHDVVPVLEDDEFLGVLSERDLVSSLGEAAIQIPPWSPTR